MVLCADRIYSCAGIFIVNAFLIGLINIQMGLRENCTVSCEVYRLDFPSRTSNSLQTSHFFLSLYTWWSSFIWPGVFEDLGYPIVSHSVYIGFPLFFMIHLNTSSTWSPKLWTVIARSILISVVRSRRFLAAISSVYVITGSSHVYSYFSLNWHMLIPPNDIF